MSEEAPKLRLRPKLTADPSAAASPPVPASVSADPTSPASTPPVPVAPATGSTPPVRLKPRIAADPIPPRPPGSSAPPLPSTDAPRPSGSTTPPIAPPALAAVVPQSSAPPSSSRPPVLPPHVVPTPEMTVAAESAEFPGVEIPASPVSLEERSRKVKQAALLIAAGGVVLFAGVGYFAFPKLIAQHVEREAEEQRLEKLLQNLREDEDTATKPRPPAGAPTPTQPAPAAPASVADAPAVAPVDTVSAGPVEPATAFRAWVGNVKIAGLRTGANPRILIGGASFNVGDTVNQQLGIRFEGYDTDRRVLLFKDATGAIVERRHP